MQKNLHALTTQSQQLENQIKIQLIETLKKLNIVLNKTLFKIQTTKPVINSKLKIILLSFLFSVY